MAPTDELAAYRDNLLWELERAMDCASELPEAQIHERPSAEDANTLAGIASHVLGAAQEHVLGWALGRSLDARIDAFDDDVSADDLRMRWQTVEQDLRRAFDEIAALGLERLVPTPGRGQQTIRAVLHWAMLHAAEHVGAAELSRGLIMTRHGSSSPPTP